MWECVALRTADRQDYGSLRPLRYTNLNSHPLEMFTVKTNDNQKDPRKTKQKDLHLQSLRDREPRAQGHKQSRTVKDIFEKPAFANIHKHLVLHFF